MPDDFTIIIDKQEKRLGIRGYNFKTIKPDPPLTVRAHLKTGDYSIKGLEGQVCVERKSINDFFSSVGRHRKRFEKEFQRMSEMQYAALILEFDFKTLFLNPPSRSKMNVKAAFRTAISWSVKYNVCIFPMWNREAAQKTTFLILKKYWDIFCENLDN